MPIHDQGYRRYGGDRTRTGAAWIVIARAGIRTFFDKKMFLALLLVAWIPFVVRAVQIFLAANVPQAQFLAPNNAPVSKRLDPERKPRRPNPALSR